ncbi:MAG: radical SAM protein [Candidatus Falkowbacteria bacterium]|nr:radical SAM protein [Candidatus Falkowbacteria bacterium]
MKIFILCPNLNEEKKSIINVRARQPLSLAIIAAILRNDGHQIKLVDANVLNLFLTKILEEINQFSPEALILTSTPDDRWECPVPFIDNIFKLINTVKVKYKILTGTHGTTMPEWIFSRCKVDYIIRGEPELATQDLIFSLSNNRTLEQVAGLSWRKEGAIINNPGQRITDLDKLPMPAYDLLPMELYGGTQFPQPFSIMMTSRGCPYNCTPCLKAMSPGVYVAQSPKKVVDEIAYLLEHFAIKFIFFQDWEFFIDCERVKKICNLILDKGLKVEWGANARATDIVRLQHFLPIIKKAGCLFINIGLESASNRILERINKKVTQNDLLSAINILRANEIKIGLCVLLNLPGEDKDSLKETANFIIDNNLEVKKFLPVIPYPGTTIFANLKKLKPGIELNWDTVENFAGSAETELRPQISHLYLRHYKNSKKYGKFYLLNPSFWLHSIRNVIKSL